MEDDERPEKRRKLDDIHDLPGPIKSQFPQEPGSQVSLGERKSNLPRVLVNKLNISHDVVGRLRQLTKFCGKRLTAEKMGSLIAKDGPNDNGEEMTDGNHNKRENESSPEEIGCDQSPDRDCKQGLPPHQNGMKRTETAVVDKGDKFEDGTNNVKPAASDFLIFRQVLKEIIEQRTKVVEEKVAANSLKLQNRIRELERENRELQWNARRIFTAFRQLLIENEKRKQPRTSRGVQVGSICESAPEQEVLESTLHTTTAREINGLSTNLASTSVTPLTSTASNVVTPAEDPQSSLQAAPRVLLNSQQPLTEKPAPTAVVYTVKPRLAQLAEQQNCINTHNRLHVPRPSANESTAVFLQGEPGQSSESLASKAFSQPPLAVQHQAKSLSELIRENQLKLRQQTQRLQRQQQLEQRRTSHPLVQSTQQHPSETTASLLQQLQRKQQLQQRQHYQRLVERQPHTTHLPTSSQITDHVTPTFSVFSSQKQLDSTPEQQTKSQSQLVRPVDGSQEMRQSANSPVAFLQQRNNSAIYQRSSPSHIHFVINSQTKTVSVPSHSPVVFNTKQIDEVLKRNETALPPNGKSLVYKATAQHESPSPSTSSKQAIINIKRSNLANSKPPVQNHINKRHVHHERLVSSAQPAAVAMMENSVAREQTNTTSQRHVSTDRFHARPKSIGMQNHVQHPSSQLQKNIQSRQPPQIATQMQNTTETRREQVSSPLSSAEINKHKPIQSDIASIQQTILVPARKKHTSEELLPSGYRFSLPSPEYLLQRRKLYEQPQNSAQPLTSQVRQVSKTHSLENTSSNERIMVSSTHPSGHANAVYMMQTSKVHTTAIPTRPFHQSGQRDGVPGQLPPPEAHIPLNYRPSENLLLQKKQHENLPQSRNQLYKPLQGQEQTNKPTVTNEGGNLPSNVPFLHRPPIQSPGISSSDPRIEKNHCEAEKASTVNTLTPKSSLHDQGNASKPLPKPSASIAAREKGIVLSWNMEHEHTSVRVDNYELFACQDVDESKGQPIKWKKIGIVKALPLPMACTLTQFSSGSKYFFSVRAVDENERAGPFSDPCTVSLNPYKVA